MIREVKVNKTSSTRKNGSAFDRKRRNFNQVVLLFSPHKAQIIRYDTHHNSLPLQLSKRIVTIMKNLTLAILLMGVCASAYAQTTSTPYQAVVAADGSGTYKTIQQAIDAAPTSQTKPWLILVKNGAYEEQVIVPENKSYIHLIGQDKEKTIVHLNLNVGGKPNGTEREGKTAYWKYSVHNPASPVYQSEGAVVMVKGTHFYAENISFVNDWGTLSENGPQALAMRSQADCAAFYRCNFRSFQDTWMTTTIVGNRHYVKDCWIEGAVDYFYGGGDVLLENCTLYSLRSGAVIVAPAHKGEKYGYAFRNCTVDGNREAADGRLKLGRPWHDSPKAVYIHTTMRIPVAKEGWTNMGAIPALFAEYDSRDAQGNIVDLSARKTEYSYQDRTTKQEVKGTCPATITQAEANRYTYENMIPGKDGWNPRAIMETLDAPRNLSYQSGTFTWLPVKQAIGYIVYDGEQIIGVTTKTSFPVPDVKYSLKVTAVNAYGSQGKKAVL